MRTKKTDKYSTSVMVWGCMNSEKTDRLHIMQGTVNAEVYNKDILIKKLLRSARDMYGDEWYIFQQDKALCHTAGSVMKWFDDNKITILYWSGNSPNLNPIENLWRRLKVLVAAKKARNKQELVEAIISSWYHVITTAELTKLAHFMPKRCASVLRSRGYALKYWIKNW